MKIAVVGCGAVGSFYGAKLCRFGQDVHFLLRSDYHVVKRHGVRIKSPQGDFHVHPRCASSPEQIGPADLVLIALKTTANREFPQLLPPLIGPQTAILTLQNGLGNEEQLAELFPVEQIMGGLCFVCLHREQPGLIRHIDHGQIMIGEHLRWPEPRTHDIATMFRNAGVPCKVSDNLARAHWEKLVWNIPFNGLGVASSAGWDALNGGSVNVQSLGPCLSTDQLIGNERWLKLVQELMMEVIETGIALKLNLDAGLVEENLERTRTMGPYKASTVLDYEKGLPLELNTLFLEPLRQARLAGVRTPRLETLCRVLEILDQNKKPG